MLSSTKGLLLAACAPLAGAPDSTSAKELPAVTLKDGFALLRAELEPDGGAYKLGQMVEAEDWEGILQYTKVYDLSFRKLTMKQVTNSLAAAGLVSAEKTGKELRDKFNYDLIALNKASRPQFRAIARPSAEADMVELKNDLNKFIALDPDPPAVTLAPATPPVDEGGG